jgi:cell division protease FtsH
MDFKKLLKGPILWIFIAVLLILIGSNIISSANAAKKVTTAEAVSAINSNDASQVKLIDREQRIEIVLRNGTKVQADFIDGQGVELQKLLQSKVDSGALARDGYDTVVPKDNLFVNLLVSLIPIAIIVLILFFFLSQMGGGNRLMAFGKAKARSLNKDMPQTTFADVAGADEAVEELHEIKEFLAEPAKFQAVGAKIPKGVLLYGPPGTGKTLLARAVAGEAGVPFFSISGSDFVEMFVGVGASRVRDLFEQAKQSAPAIIFVDEIDAVGRQRGAGLGGGHDEREQTLNQLLVEMDGFDVSVGVILIAATNRPDVLDPALLRPGRFDRQIAVERPDLKGREQILKVHAKGKPIAKDVNLLDVARRTPGFTGADLANVLNEAALLTAREKKKVLDRVIMDEAIDRVVAGPQKKTRLMSEKEKLITAYHEGGHALVAAALPDTDPVHKITIMPRGRALGYTMVLPEDDKYSNTRNQMLDQLAYMLGGRAAEEMVFHDPTTGASNDIEKATQVAKAMVTQFGMTEKLGAMKYGSTGQDVFLGRDLMHQKDYSETVAAIIDDEIRALIETAHLEAYKILEDNRQTLDDLVLALLDRETLNKEEIAEIFKPLKKRHARPPWTGSIKRKPSRKPPVKAVENKKAPKKTQPGVVAPKSNKPK